MGGTVISLKKHIIHLKINFVTIVLLDYLLIIVMWIKKSIQTCK